MSKLEQLIDELCPDGVEYMAISEVCNINRGVVISKEDISNSIGEYPVYSSQTENNGELGKINTYAFDGEYLTWTTDGANAGTVFYRTGKFSVTNVCGLLKVIASDNLAKYIFHVLSVEAPKYVRRGMGNPKLMSNVMGSIKIPLPPFPVQREIVRILDNFTELTAELTAELTVRKKQYEYYRNRLFTLNSVPLERLDDVAVMKRGDYITKKSVVSGDIPVILGGQEPAYYCNQSNHNGEAIVISRSGAYAGFVSFWNCPIFVTDGFIIETKDKLNLRFLYHYFKNIQQDLHDTKRGGGVPHVRGNEIMNMKIPVPPLPKQQRIVDILDRFDTLCNDISSGLPAEIKARQQQYEYYQDKLLTFKKLDAEV